MALVRRDNRLQLARYAANTALAAGGGASYGGTIAGAAARAIARAAVNEALRRYASTTNGSSSSAGQQKKKKKKGGGKGGETSVISAAAMTSARIFSKSEKRSMRVNGSFLVALPQNADGGNTWLMRLALVTDGSATFLGYYSPKLVQFASMYRHWNLKSLRAEWVPNISDTYSGSYAMGFDAETKCDPTTDFNKIYSQEVSTVSSILKSSSVTWKPHSSRDREERYCQKSASTGAAETRNYDDVCFGTLTSRFISTATTGVSLGYVKIDYVIDFDEECSF